MSGFGQAQGSRGPIQETGPELTLEVADLPADRRFCDAKRARRARKRLRLGDGDERSRARRSWSICSSLENSHVKRHDRLFFEISRRAYELVERGRPVAPKPGGSDHVARLASPAKPLIPAVAALQALSPLAEPLVRAAAGLMLMPHGAQKLFGWFGGYGVDATGQFFAAKLGLPPSLACRPG